MKADTEIKRDVEAELRWAPEIDDTDIAVKVLNRVVTLSGSVHRFLDKYEAELAAKRVEGVAGIANDIEVRLGSGDGISDPEIARNVVAAIAADLPIASEKIKVLVHGGRVTLEGKLEWNYQRIQAERAVRRQKGVLAVVNLIELTPKAAPQDIKRRIQTAFHRSAQIDANLITVEAKEGLVTLKGRVRSWAEREEAQDTAWCAPGVTQVKNEITVGP